MTRKSVTSSNGDSKTTYVSQSSNGTVESSDTSGQSFAGTSGTEGWWSRLWAW